MEAFAAPSPRGRPRRTAGRGPSARRPGLALAALIPLLALAAPAAAQHPIDETLRERGLPRRTVERLVALYDDVATDRRTGPVHVAAGVVVQGNLAVVGGPVTLAGRVVGQLLVVDGNLDLEPGASVGGDVTVVGGEARGIAPQAVGGSLTVYGPATGVALEDAERSPDRRRPWRRSRLDRSVRFGDSRLSLRLGPNYNRVEGLPILFGPVIETAGSNPLRVEAMAVFRTESDRPLDGDQVGYTARVEQFAGGHQALRFGLGARSLVTPIEAWGLSDLEASLSTVLFHDDQRDYFERTGWSAYARVTPPGFPLDATLEYRQEDHEPAAVADPWTLFGDDPWRAQPLAAQGKLRSLIASAEVDLRDDRDDPVDGWFARATIERGLGGSLRIPETFVLLPDAEEPILAAPAQSADARFSRGFIDVRRYSRAGRGATLALRGVVGGSLSRSALPPQFQHALGGPGTLPGYDLFQGDCGARTAIVRIDAEAAGPAFFPRYGCDRIALFQAEYRGGLTIDFGGGRDDDRDDDWTDWGDWGWDVGLDWVVFFDAARGWSYNGGGSGAAARSDTGALYDAGLGLLIDDFGIYAAVPLNGERRDVNFMIRLGRRF